jgi:hypothetical protein
MLCTPAALLARPCASYRRSNLSKKILERFEFRTHRPLPVLTVSAGLLCSFVLLPSLRSGAAFLSSSTNSGHHQVFAQVSEAVFVRPARSRQLLTWFGYPCLPCVRFPATAGVGCRLACELRCLFLLLVLHILILCFSYAF